MGEGRYEQWIYPYTSQFPGDAAVFFLVGRIWIISQSSLRQFDVSGVGYIKFV